MYMHFKTACVICCYKIKMPAVHAGILILQQHKPAYILYLTLIFLNSCVKMAGCSDFFKNIFIKKINRHNLSHLN